MIDFNKKAKEIVQDILNHKTPLKMLCDLIDEDEDEDDGYERKKFYKIIGNPKLINLRLEFKKILDFCYNLDGKDNDYDDVIESMLINGFFGGLKINGFYDVLRIENQKLRKKKLKRILK